MKRFRIISCFCLLVLLSISNALLSPTNLRKAHLGKYFQSRNYVTLTIANNEAKLNQNLIIASTNNDSHQQSFPFQSTLILCIGYAMLLGSMMIYCPIMFTLLKNRMVEGYSETTWLLNFLSYLLSIIYQFKKKIPLMSYVELIFGGIHSFSVFGILCHLKAEYSLFLSVAVSSGLLSFFLCSRKFNNSDRILDSLQLLSAFLANYAIIPQILLSYQLKTSSWSSITALLSIVGCVLRIITTMQTSKDRYILASYGIGVFVHSILLFQTLAYPNV
jgi:hypothetical protein